MIYNGLAISASIHRLQVGKHWRNVVLQVHADTLIMNKCDVMTFLATQCTHSSSS